MIYRLMGRAHAAISRRVRAIQGLAEGERGQGTVEYVGLILLVGGALVLGGARHRREIRAAQEQSPPPQQPLPNQPQT